MEDDALGAYVDAAAAAVGLPIPSEYRDGVIANLKIILRQSAPLLALPLDESEEAAPVFRP